MKNWETYTVLFAVSQTLRGVMVHVGLTVYFLEKEIEIVYALAQRVLQHEKTLVEASDICGQIDR